MIAFLLATAIWPPWQTVAQGAAVGFHPSRPEAIVAGTYRATTAFTAYLRDEDKIAVAQVDFRHVVLVAALTATPTPCYRLEIINLQRKRRTLVVTTVLHPPPANRGCIFAVGGPYHVISVARRIIGRPLPRRIVLKEQQPALSPREVARALPLPSGSAFAADVVRPG